MSGDRGAVLITGASTGIGEACALHLASLGFDVHAGVRRDEDGERLRATGGERLRPLKIDVAEAGSIAAAASEVSGAMDGRGLAGLVNNAGIAVSGPLEYVPVEELRRQLEVNVVGQVAVTQALLPLLRVAGGRVVNIGSIGGRIALPLLGPYAASKFAMEAITDSLRRELRGSGISVSIVEPGSIATPIWEKAGPDADRVVEDMPAEGRERYAHLISAVRAEVARAPERGLPPLAVAKVVEHALTARRPRTRYLVGRDAKMRAKLARLLPDRAFDALVARALRG